MVIQITNQTEIDWTVKGALRIAQNVLNLLKTFRYEVAYDRTLGMPKDYIDLPIDQAIPKLTAAVYELIREKEPRANLLKFNYQGIDKSGNMLFEVVIEV